MAERDREARLNAPLESLARAPRVVEKGRARVRGPEGARVLGYLIQERVLGRTLAELLESRDPAERAHALAAARELFAELLRARIRLNDFVRMAANIMVGSVARDPAARAYVVDADDAEIVGRRGWLDSLSGRPDPLELYYETILKTIRTSPTDLTSRQMGR